MRNDPQKKYEKVVCDKYFTWSILDVQVSFIQRSGRLWWSNETVQHSQVVFCHCAMNHRAQKWSLLLKKSQIEQREEVLALAESPETHHLQLLVCWNRPRPPERAVNQREKTAEQPNSAPALETCFSRQSSSPTND